MRFGAFCRNESIAAMQIRGVDHLKELIEKWHRFDENMIDGAVNSGMIDCINVYARKGDISNI